jgi:hypothetical protein
MLQIGKWEIGKAKHLSAPIRKGTSKSIVLNYKIVRDITNKLIN